MSREVAPPNRAIVCALYACRAWLKADALAANSYLVNAGINAERFQDGVSALVAFIRYKRLKQKPNWPAAQWRDHNARMLIIAPIQVVDRLTLVWAVRTKRLTISAIRAFLITGELPESLAEQHHQPPPLLQAAA